MPSAVPADGGGAARVPAGDGGTNRLDDPGSAPLLSVGRIVKPHGLRGDVVVSLTTNREERAAAGSVLVTADGGQLEVERSTPHRGRHIVTFASVRSIEAAEELRGTDLFAEPLSDPDELWVHELIGSTVVDTSGRVLGTVDAVEANPASDLLVLSGGELIPLRFVTGSQPGVRITVEIPDGLLDLP